MHSHIAAAFFRSFVGVMALLLCACGSEQAPNAGNHERPAIGVTAHKVTYRREVLRIESVGTARAQASAIIFPETGGEVAEVLFETGGLVEAGAPLVKLESREEELAVRLAQVELRNAEQLLARYRRIEDTGAISDSQIDEGQTAVDAARLSLERAENSLSERTAAAPFAGHVGLSDVDVGARVTSTTEIVRLDDRSRLYVDFAAPEQVFGRMKLGDEVTVTPFADDNKQIPAKIVELDSRIDPVRRTLTVRTEIDNLNDALRPGMSFRVVFKIQGDSYAVVPEAAVLWGSDGAYVWGIDGDQTKRKPVTIVSREEGHVLVRGDLPENYQIVFEGIQKVRDGTTVTILNQSIETPLSVGAAANGAGND